MKFWFLFVLTLPIYGFSQLNFQLGQVLTCGNQKAGHQVAFENYTGTYRCDFRKPGTETFFKVSAYHLNDSTKFSLKYTLAFGLKYSHYYLESLNTPNTGYFGDTLFGVGASNFYTRAISWTNGIDLIFRISPKFTFIQTLGIKAAATNKGRDEKLWGIGAKSYTWSYEYHKFPFINPVITLMVAPQVLIHFLGFSLGIHLNQDVLVMNNPINNLNYPQPKLGKMQLSCYTALGISVMPTYYLKRSKNLPEIPD